MRPLKFLLLLFTVSAASSAQQKLRLSLADAIAMTVSPGTKNTSVALADAAQASAQARVKYAHAFLFPLLEATVGESNITRNLSAEGFYFPTGVPNFNIPSKVGPFNNFDARVIMSDNLFDLSAIRRARGLKASLSASGADVEVHRNLAAAQVAHDYLIALRASATMEATQAALVQSQSLQQLAQDRVDTGKAADLEVTRAKLRLSADKRRLTAAQNSRDQARLQLLLDLGLSFSTEIELTDHLANPSAAVNEEASLAAALQSRPELRLAYSRNEEARDNDSAIRAERLPVVTAYGDVGPLADVVTHTVGISARVTIFDGGRREARRMETQSAVHQTALQQADLRRRIELEVRSAAANLRAAASQADECALALTLAQDELQQAQRRFEAGVSGNSDLVDAQAREALAHDDLIGAAFTWNQARIDLAQATGAITTFSLQ